MSITSKRRCPDPLKDFMNDSLEKRIKRISVEGNIGKDIFHYPTEEKQNVKLRLTLAESNELFYKVQTMLARK